jgi:hypothetical protein
MIPLPFSVLLFTTIYYDLVRSIVNQSRVVKEQRNQFDFNEKKSERETVKGVEE